METNLRTVVWARLLLILALLLPLVILFLLPGGALVRGGPWFWLVLLLCFSVIWALLAPSPRAAGRAAEPAFQVLPPEEQPEVVREVMNVRLATEQAGVRTFHGPLREPAGTAYDKLQRAFPAAGAGQYEIHTVNEYVDLPELANGCRLAVALATLEG